MEVKNSIISFLLVLFCFQTLFSQELYEPKEVNPLSQSWRWKQFPELEGLGVRDIYEGPNKSVWVASNGGVYQYDGYNWKIHNEENGFISSPIEQVIVDNNNNAYAASTGGIYKYDGKVWTQIFVTPSNLSFDFNNLKLLEDNLVAATCNRGFLILGETNRLYTSEAKKSTLQSLLHDVEVIALPHEFLPNEDFRNVSDILEDQHQKIWIGFTLENEQGRILRFSRENLELSQIKNYEIFASTERVKLGESQKFLEAHDGAIWIINSTYKTGISIYKEGKWSYLKLNDELGGDEYMNDIVESTDGTIWIGSLGKLYTYKNKKWSVYLAPLHPIPANQVMLHKSKGNYIWVAGNKSKVYYLDFSTDQWVTYDKLNFQFQNKLGEDWFLDVNGKVVFQDGTKWYAYSAKDGLMDAPIRIIQTRNGEIWAAGSHQGIASTAVLVDGKWVRKDHPYLSWGIDYRSIFEDKDGNIWFGAAVDAETEKGQFAGLLKYRTNTDEKEKWIHYPGLANGLSQSNVYGIGQSGDGRIWIGGGSLHSFDGKEWKKPLDKQLQQFVNVAYSNNGLFFAGSRYYGVFTFDGQEWNHYDKSSGLAGNTIISIDAIDSTTVYVATDNDISRFNGESWVKNIFPAELNMEFEGGQLLHDRNGTLWINKSKRAWKRRAFSHNKSNQNNSSDFLAYRYKPDINPPETEIFMLDDEISPEGNAVINWSGRDYFEQTAHDNLMYSYSLNGGEWSPFTYDKQYTFVSLSNGRHELKVRSRDLDLNVDPSPAVMQFRVLPPIWKQTWFILLMLAFASVLAIYEYRIITKKKKLEALNKSLQSVNEKLKFKSSQIRAQNMEILKQQKKNLSQAKALEITNQNLEERNNEIESQKEKLELMLVKIEELSNAKIGFFTNISHELRTPLTLINGPIQQLFHHSQNLTTLQKEKLYQVIQRNLSRLLKLIDQLLEMRKLENSNLEINRKTLDLPMFLKSIVSFYDSLAIEKEILLGFEYDLDGNYFAIDTDKLEKVLVNLISNAFKYTPNGGAIQIKLSNSYDYNSSLNAHESYMKIMVQDSGEGISEEDLAHIYDRFFTKGNHTTNGTGTGIGLAYTKALMEVMEGDIEVFSEVGEGTTFVLYLPLISKIDNIELAKYHGYDFHLAKKEADMLFTSFEVQNELQSTLHSLNVASRKKILLVEDNPDMIQYVGSLLENKYDVTKAFNGLEGLKKAKELSIDLIISDVMMPKMNGLEFCEKIKADLTTSHIPVILLTAKVLEENEIEGYVHGADEYITKPFSPNLLLSRVANILDQREILKSSIIRDFMLTPQKLNLTSPDEELMQKTISIMEENIENSDFNVDQMCKMVHLSHMHFIRKIKQLTGKKPVDLLKSFRLRRAKDLLIGNDINISEIAYRVGYDLPNSFSRAFKKEFGMSPKEYKENNLENAENN
ncbi:hybrid sensor histidine kinase/response regulator transcription factor [Portibacter lacus]|uniref:histidine kinase n=1 Tax=Portibacter lacus TaxID=1099794 RepID=A0AA37SJ89_9BACT|nr:ATP-binding protein [Portibacter lacus]GLR15466.1 hypothetical protein GCM10007940_00810 [Portibacter lacus]